MWLLSSFRVKNAVRTKRTFRFHEKGKFQALAQRIRAKVCRNTVHSSVLLLYISGKNVHCEIFSIIYMVFINTKNCIFYAKNNLGHFVYH